MALGQAPLLLLRSSLNVPPSPGWKSTSVQLYSSPTLRTTLQADPANATAPRPALTEQKEAKYNEDILPHF